MIALAYLAVAVFLGDALASRWFRPVTWFHRLAAAFLVGLLIATWVTYLTSLLFDGRTEDALLVGNLASGWAMALAAIAIYRWVPRPPRRRPPATPDPWLGRHHARCDRAARDLDDDLHLFVFER